MLVDTGPDETYPALRARLMKLPKNAQGKRHIDLFVVTHIDHDHIGAAGLLLDDAELGLSFSDIWFNAPKPAATRGVAEGIRLAQFLGSSKAGLPWNLAFGGKRACTPAIGGGIELTGKGLPKLTLLSPTPDRIEALFRVWEKELQRLRSREHDTTPVAAALVRGPEATLEELASRRTPVDTSIPNGSSIALLVEHRGASILLGADAVPEVMVPAMKALIDRRRLKGPLPVDAYKLSHHGSKANLSDELLGLIRAHHYVVSTDNSRFRHPDPEVIARIILGRKGACLWFDYNTPQNRRWANSDLLAKYGHRVRFPTQPRNGVVLQLPQA